MIGGGDWASDRLVPDVIHAFAEGRRPSLRHPDATRPWQHVLAPLSGYLRLCEALCEGGDAYAEAWNFGPDMTEARPVRYVAERLCALLGADPDWIHSTDDGPPESASLALDSAKARIRLGWQPAWSFEESLARVAQWHRAHQDGADARTLTCAQIADYQQALSGEPRDQCVDGEPMGRKQLVV